MNIDFPFVISVSQNYIQRNKLRYLESRYLKHFYGIGSKHSIFDDVLLEETAHAQLEHHTRKSWKAWKNSVPWEKCHQGTLLASAVSVFWIFHGITTKYASYNILGWITEIWSFSKRIQLYIAQFKALNERVSEWPYILVKFGQAVPEIFAF